MTNKQYSPNLLIEIMMESNSLDKYRAIFYRIVPSQLTWFDRVFHNKWKRLWRASLFNGGKMWYFDAADFKKHLANLKTLGDVENFLESETSFAKKIRQEEIERRRKQYEAGEIWEDEIEDF